MRPLKAWKADQAFHYRNLHRIGPLYRSARNCLVYLDNMLCYSNIIFLPAAEWDLQFWSWAL
jgi:hypothetical protein